MMFSYFSRLKVLAALLVLSLGGWHLPATAQETPAQTPSQEQSAKVNINTASAQELTSLNGIGPAKAKAIVEYREANGAFKAVDDLMAVSGIGPATVEAIGDQIAL